MIIPDEVAAVLSLQDIVKNATSGMTAMRASRRARITDRITYCMTESIMLAIQNHRLHTGRPKTVLLFWTLRHAEASEYARMLESVR